MSRINIANPFEVELELESKAGKPIENYQHHNTFTPFEVKKYEDVHRSTYKSLKVRVEGCTSIYNCHGMVFASRRTQIIGTPVVRQVLKEDRYMAVEPKNVLPGDIILYVHQSGDISHSGIVLWESLIPFDPFVVSKWGPWVEAIHTAYDCLYAREPGVTIEYHRAQP